MEDFSLGHEFQEVGFFELSGEVLGTAKVAVNRRVSPKATNGAGVRFVSRVALSLPSVWALVERATHFQVSQFVAVQSRARFFSVWFIAFGWGYRQPRPLGMLEHQFGGPSLAYVLHLQAFSSLTWQPEIVSPVFV